MVSRLATWPIAAAFLLTAALLLSGQDASAQQNKPAANGPDITGFWRDQHGDRIWIQSQNGRVQFKAPIRRTLIGTQSGNSLSLSAPFKGTDVTGAPAAVIAAIDAKNVTVDFKGTIVSGFKIVATETEPIDIKWEGNDLTAFKMGTTHITLVSAIKVDVTIPNVDDDVLP
jgi:hypothetical protein